MIMLFRRMGNALRKRQFGQMFYEFMLIFLAVMAGFAAENWRENLEDKKRLKEYLVSMRNDLQADQQEAERIGTKNKHVLANIDYILSHIQDEQTDSVLLQVYTKARFLMRDFDMLALQEQTYTQMKSAGDLRLIRSPVLAEQIGNYYAQLKLFEINSQVVNDEISEVHRAEKGVFDGELFHAIARGGDTLLLRQLVSSVRKQVPRQGAVGDYRHSVGQLFGSIDVHATDITSCAEKAGQLEALITAELKKLE